MTKNLSIRPRAFDRYEAIRLFILLAVAGWLLHPFATNRQVGAGDALWYANMLADFVTQWRHGIFPVFVGQSEFAFNGAVYPLRVAPLFQHLAGVLDLITFQQLGWFTLQHLSVIVCGIGGIFGCYFALCSTAPQRRWQATGLAILYLSCPGLIGTVFTFDLYMTWMTVPFVPLVFYGVVRSFQRDDLAAQVWIGASLAALWMAHSPIALWASLLTAGTQAVRLMTVHLNFRSWRTATIGAVLFLILGQYPFVSIAALGGGGGSPALNNFQRPELIGQNIARAFPDALLPVSASAAGPGDLQLGYGLWTVFLAALTISFFTRSHLLRALVSGAAVLLLLVLPVPWLTNWTWMHFPQAIQRITYYWPMQRFYLLLAGLLVVAGQVTLINFSRRASQITGWVIFSLASWSVWEARHFVEAVENRTAPVAASERAQRPENLLLMNHAYGLFAALPGYFSNGVMDPSFENRLIDRTTFRAISPLTSDPLSEGWLRGAADQNPGIIKFAPTFSLAAGRSYELRLDFLDEEYAGVLQLTGREFFREYRLPQSGEPMAFGTGPINSKILPLRSTSESGDQITLRYIPNRGMPDPEKFTRFAKYSFGEILPSRAAVQINSLLPLRVTTRSAVPAWLETARMYQPGYRAEVDGRPIEARRSPQLLVMIPVEAGSHQVELRYVGPASLRISYWFSLAAWMGLAALASWAAWKKSRRVVDGV